MLAHRKYDSREASSYWPIRCAFAGPLTGRFAVDYYDYKLATVATKVR